jgi:hypothetical protein
MLTATLIVSLALLQQPGRDAAQARRARTAAYDSSTAAVSHLADRVADVKSGLELFRRAAFGGTDDELISAADGFWIRCHALDSVAVLTYRTVCTRCAFQPPVQRALNGYREIVPSVGRAGAGCASRIAQLSRRPDAAKQLRREVRDIGNPIVGALIGYERRLSVLLVALNAKPAP